jgi:hypothetical protein
MLDFGGVLGGDEHLRNLEAATYACKGVTCVFVGAE